MTQGTKQNWQNGEGEPLPLSCQRTPPLCGPGAGAQEDGKDLELLGHLLWGTWPLGELVAEETNNVPADSPGLESGSVLTVSVTLKISLSFSRLQCPQL